MVEQAVRRKLPPPEPLSQDVPMTNTADCIAPEEYVARDEIFKVAFTIQCALYPPASFTCRRHKLLMTDAAEASLHASQLPQT